MRNSSLEDFQKYLCQTSPQPLGIEVERASGVYIFDRSGKAYLDFISGIGVANIGHGHRRVLEAISQQAKKHLHVMVYGEYVQEAQVKYARRLTGLAPVEDGVVFFCNSGAEAIEGALKTARKFTKRSKFVAFHGGYHGDTFGALSAMSSKYYRDAFEPLLPTFGFLDFDNLDALAQIDSTVAAVLVEPIQGEGGVRVPRPDFLPAVQRRCNETGALLICDEVMTGFGRTGKFFACEHWQAKPDIMCLAKALGGGLPLGAFIGRREIMRTLSENPPLSHVTTFGGHPLSCAAGLAATEVILDEKLMDRAARIGNDFLETLRGVFAGNQRVCDIRGLGCFFAIEFNDEAAAEKFVAACRQRGLIIGWTLHYTTIVRMAPPLVISHDELAQATEIIKSAIQEVK
jgi:acetylornithine/succinyldiaminopimelate/putrescine aminotransferase